MKALKTALKFLAMGLILYYLYEKGLLDFSKIASVVVQPGVFLAGILGLSITTVLSVYRWQLLLRGQGIALSFKEALRLTFIGMFFNTALPGAVSGDVVKGYYIVKQQPDKKGKSKAFATLLLDRIFGLSGLIFIAFVSMVTHFGDMNANPLLRPLIAMIGALMAGVLVFFYFVLAGGRWISWIQDMIAKLPRSEILLKLFDAVKCYDQNRGLVAKGLAVSVLIHSLLVSMLLFFSSQMGGFESVPEGLFFLLGPLGLLVTAIPVAPAGVGTGHAAFFALFHLLGSGRGADLFSIFVMFQLLMGLVGGIVYVLSSNAQERHQLEDAAQGGDTEMAL